MKKNEYKNYAIEMKIIRLGVANTYLIRAQSNKWIMIDAGAPRKIKSFMRQLNKHEIDPKDIELLILTHGHYDHVGNASEIRDITGAKIAVHKNEVSWLKDGKQPLSPGHKLWPKILGFILKTFLPFNKFTPCNPDILLDDVMNLAGVGINGLVIHTPGHSPGSVSVILYNGFVFVGDLAMNGLPLRCGPGASIFIENKEDYIKSCEKIFNHGATRIFPAHGNPFEVAYLKQDYLSLKKSRSLQ